MPLDAGEGETAFLVPALLPKSVPHETKLPDVEPKLVYLACYTGEPLLQFAYIEHSKLGARCALPAGLFEQVGFEVCGGKLAGLQAGRQSIRSSHRHKLGVNKQV